VSIVAHFLHINPPLLIQALPSGLHYLSIAWGVALMYHAPNRIFWLIGAPLFVYLVDKVVEIFSRTFLIESAAFERLGDSICVITFENPPSFGKQNSKLSICVLDAALAE
jgi:hypothetical protein